MGGLLESKMTKEEYENRNDSNELAPAQGVALFFILCVAFDVLLILGAIRVWGWFCHS